MTSQQAVTHADGAFMAPEALGIVKNCPHLEEAKKFADYLLSKKVVDEIFAKFSRRPASSLGPSSCG
jgi:ABC-type Fe3+ transport system substrate-binding protein